MALVMSVWMGSIIFMMILAETLSFEILALMALLALILIAENRTPFYLKPTYLIRLYSITGVGIVIFLLTLLETIQGVLG